MSPAAGILGQARFRTLHFALGFAGPHGGRELAGRSHQIFIIGSVGHARRVLFNVVEKVLQFFAYRALFVLQVAHAGLEGRIIFASLPG